MKKKLTRWSLVLATVLFVFAGCSLLDDDYDEDMIVGSWTTSGWTYVFNEDHTGSRTQSGRTQDFTWSLDGDELELEVQGYEQGKTEIITFVVYIIQDLTETRMEVYDSADSKKEIIVFKKQ